MDKPIESKIRALLPQKTLDEEIIAYIVSLLKEIVNDDSCSTDAASLEQEIGPFLEGCDVKSICKNLSAILPEKKRADSRVRTDSKIASSPKAPQAVTSPAPKQLYLSAPVSNTTVAAPPAPAPATSAQPSSAVTATGANQLPAASDEDSSVSVYGCGGTRGRFPAGLSKDVNISIDLTVRTSDLLVAAPLRLIYGHRYGLVGKNGIGKSTLLDRLARGTVAGFPPHLRVLHVKQEILGDERSAPDVVQQSDEEAYSLQQEEQRLLADDPSNTASTRLTEIYKRLEELDAASALARAKAVLKSFGFSDEQMQKPTEQLSGGWRMRVSLACAKFLDPDVLLLDEPTNHLDLESVLWLQSVLVKFAGTLIVVSHDRSFLQYVCTDIIHFHKRTLTNYPCRFVDFLRVREEKLKKKARLQEELDKKREQMQKSISKMASMANKNELDQKRMGQVASRKKKLLRMGLEKTEDGRKWNCQRHGARIGSVNSNGGGWKNGKRTAAPVIELPDASFDFEFPSAEPLGTHRAILTLDDVSYTYPNAPKPQLKNVNLRLDADSRLVVLGQNGSGKSTLLNLIVGDLEPTTGTITRHQNLRIAHFTQHHVHALDYSLSPLQHLGQIDPRAPEQELRADLGSFGLHGNIALQKIGSLSGGQKARVVFAAITLNPPHLLVLDEPSNHLDFDTIEALTVALQEFEGAIILVTHDAYVIEALGEEDEVQIVAVANYRVKPWTDSFNAYKRTMMNYVEEDEEANTKN